MKQPIGLAPLIQSRNNRAATVLRLALPASVTPTLAPLPSKQPWKKKTLADEVMRLVIFLTKDDHLKYCPHCREVQYRRYKTVELSILNPERTNYRIIYPRVSSKIRCFKWPILRWFFGVPPYSTMRGWFRISPYVCCPTVGCPGSTFHLVIERQGVRKLSLQRRLTERMKSWIPGGTHTYCKLRPTPI